MAHLHPLFAAALGHEVHLAYLRIDPDQGGPNAAHLTGRLGVVLDDDVLTELVIETDGGAHYVKVDRVVQLEVLA